VGSDPSPGPGPRRTFRLRQACSLLLRDWEQASGYAADLLDRIAVGLPAADRAALQRLFFAVLRHQRLLDHLVSSLTGRRPDPLARRLLRIGLADLLILGSPPHAAVHETVALAGRSKPLVNAVLRRAVRESDALRASFPSLPPPIRCSVPDLLWERWTREFGEEAALRLAAWNQEPAPVYLRLHGGPSLPDTDTVPGSSHHVRLRERAPLPRQALENGTAYAQDPSTQKAIDLLDVRPGLRILDACAAPGGKTLAICQAGATPGLVWAADSSEARLETLRANLARLRLGTSVTVFRKDWMEDQATAAPDLPQTFDRILLDAPCSNTGVIRRRVDVPWRLREHDFRTLPDLQLRLLEAVCPHLARGGRLVYSTCSLDRAENEAVTEAFLAAHPAFRLREAHRVLPWIDGFDGAYAAALEASPG